MSGKPGNNDVTVISEKLTADLTAQKTAVIRAMLAQRHDVALACVVHTMALQSLYRRSRDSSCLAIAMQSASLQSAMVNPVDCRGLAAIGRERERWSVLLPDNTSRLWDWCLSQPREMLLDLLALCASLSVDGVRGKGEFL